MARGFLSGAIWGTVLAVGGLGTLSVVTSGPTAPTVPSADLSATPDAADAPTDPTATGADPVTLEDTTASEDTSAQPVPEQSADATASDPAATPEPTATPEPESEAEARQEAPAPEPARRPSDVTEVTPDARTPDLAAPTTPQDTAPDETAAPPMPAPDTGEAIAALPQPDAPEAPTLSTGSEIDRAPGSADAPALTTPQSETGLNISTEPAQPPAPVVPDVETALVPDAEEPAVAEAEPEPDFAPPAAQSDAPEATAAPESPPAPSDPEPDAGERNATDDTAPTDRPQVRRLVPATPDEEGGTGLSQDSTAALQRPSIGRPAASLTDRNPGNSARLPSISDPSSEETSPQADAPSPALTDGLPPLQRFAASVDSDPDLPRMAIVMIDDGSGPLGPETLDAFPFPVTFALDPGQPGAAARMAAYRALGYEVAALVELPQAAQPSDVEQILGGATAALPEAVALIEAPDGGLQATREVTEQAASYAADSGHGLVFLPNGLNTAQAIAQRADVPSISILRDFDGDGQDARTKRRFLDGAAFRARQDGAVVMLGRLTPDTLSALVLWSLQDRASSVAMVPVSSLLLDQTN